jgi:hypothetical protein
MIDTALLTMIAENCRRKLAAGVTVDAGCVYKEISRHIFRQSVLDVSHMKELSEQMMAEATARFKLTNSFTKAFRSPSIACFGFAQKVGF